MVNKFYYIKGGSETYYFALKRLLEAKGHTVVDFSMKDERNLDSSYSNYFVNNVDYNANMGIKEKAKVAMNIIYSLEAKKKFEALINEVTPDLIHLHIFQHQLSPSILDVIKKYDIPTVYTAHDLKMLCLNYKMMRHGRICEECKSGKYYRCVRNRCVKDSFIKSFITTVEGYFHQWHKSYDVIDDIITPSAFYRSKFIEFGVDSKRIWHLPNFLDTENPKYSESKDTKQYYLYFGRLSEEKGIITLLKAVQGLDSLLYIVGTGPLKENIEKYVLKNKMRNVKILGFKQGNELKNIVGNAKAVIIPSEWYENGPYSAIEALQMRRPVIGSNIGGIPELVDENGFLFTMGNIKELRSLLVQFDSIDKESYMAMEKASYGVFMRNYSKDVHYDKLMCVYNNALYKHRRRSDGLGIKMSDTN